MLALKLKKFFRKYSSLPIVFCNPVVHTAIEVDWGEAVVAFSLPAVLEMQVDGRRPFGIVFLVNRNVIAVAFEERLGGTLDLNPCVARNDAVFAELWLVDHNAELVLALAAFHRNF